MSAPARFRRYSFVLLTALSLVLIVQGSAAPVQSLLAESKVFRKILVPSACSTYAIIYPSWTQQALLEYGKSPFRLTGHSASAPSSSSHKPFLLGEDANPSDPVRSRPDDGGTRLRFRLVSFQVLLPSRPELPYR